MAARSRLERGPEEKRGKEGAAAGGLGARSRRGERAAASEEEAERGGGGARSWAAALGLAVAGSAGPHGSPRWTAELAGLLYGTGSGSRAPVHPGRGAPKGSPLQAANFKPLASAGPNTPPRSLAAATAWAPKPPVEICASRVSPPANPTVSGRQPPAPHQTPPGSRLPRTSFLTSTVPSPPSSFPRLASTPSISSSSPPISTLLPLPRPLR